jgi:hypothetical protein
MNENLQRLIILFLICLPIKFETVKKFWYFVVVWIIFLILFNYFVLKSVIDAFNHP